MGDPATELWTGFPRALTVDYPATVPLGATLIEVTVTDNGTGDYTSYVIDTVIADVITLAEGYFLDEAQDLDVTIAEETVVDGADEFDPIFEVTLTEFQRASYVEFYEAQGMSPGEIDDAID